MFSNTRLVQAIQIGIFIAVGVLGYMYVSKSIDSSLIYEISEKHKLYGAALFACIMFGTTVFAPLSSLPLVPMIAPILGPFTTGVACYVGWFSGACVAFQIGRRYGQPYVTKIWSSEVLNRYIHYTQKDMSFIQVAILCLILPVDILSYILSTCTTVSFFKYACASAIGILWFSFAFAYLGEALMNGNTVLLMKVGVASVAILIGAGCYTRYRYRKIV